MSRSVNKVTLVGNVGNDPEIKSTSRGSKVARVSLATSRKWKNDAGQEQERTEWHSLQCWGKLADIVEQWVRKGDKLYVEGRIEYNKVESDEGVKYFTNVVVQELVMLGSSGSTRRSGAYEPEEAEEPPVRRPAAAGAPKKDPDDDLPF